MVYYVSKKKYIGTLSVLNLSTELIKTLFQFKGNAGKPIMIGEDYLAIAINIDFGEGKIYFVNKHTGEIKWEREIYSTGLTTMIACFNNSMFFVDMQKELKNSLVEIDMQTGDIINKIKPKKSGWFSYKEYVDQPFIEFDGENILLYGEMFSVYNTKSKKLITITKIPEVEYGSILNNGKIIYHDKKTVYSFDIEEETIKEIYKLAEMIYLEFLQKTTMQKMYIKQWQIIKISLMLC